MLGIHDPLILLAYLGCVLVALFSVVYGVARRNRAPDRLTREDRAWAQAERKAENEI